MLPLYSNLYLFCMTIALKDPAMPRPLPIPPSQALHAAPYIQHGSMIIGHKEISMGVPGRVCSLCQRYGNPSFPTCPGRSRHNICVYFNQDGSRKKPPFFPVKTRTCRKCGKVGCKGVGGHKYCTNR